MPMTTFFIPLSASAWLQGGVLRVLDRHREMVRLADGLDERHLLSIDAQWRALACLALGANSYLCGREGAVDLMREALFENEAAGTTTRLVPEPEQCCILPEGEAP